MHTKHAPRTCSTLAYAARGKKKEKKEEKKEHPCNFIKGITHAVSLKYFIIMVSLVHLPTVTPLLGVPKCL